MGGLQKQDSHGKKRKKLSFALFPHNIFKYLTIRYRTVHVIVETSIHRLLSTLFGRDFFTEFSPEILHTKADKKSDYSVIITLTNMTITLFWFYE